LREVSLSGSFCFWFPPSRLFSSSLLLPFPCISQFRDIKTDHRDQTAMYARVFYPDGSGDYETSHGLDNQVLGLPHEDLDTATRKTIEMVNSGWNPFA
jgi:hypothetical protein